MRAFGELGNVRILEFQYDDTPIALPPAPSAPAMPDMQQPSLLDLVAETPEQPVEGEVDSPADGAGGDTLFVKNGTYILVQDTESGRTLRLDHDFFDLDAAQRMTELATALSDHLPKVGTVYKRERAVGRLNSMIDLAEIVDDVSTRGVGIQRYKGLGEMNPTQLWETTLDPESRTLFKVEIEDAQGASDLFEMLMGEEVRPRATFIRAHAQEVQNLDV